MGEPLRVLVVDDEEDILDTLSYSLDLRGYRVATARDGIEALEEAKSRPPDVMLLDVMLPGCNGYEVSRLLKEWMDSWPGRRFPIILLTARKIDDPDRERFIATWSRADGCLYKPYDLDEVLACIERSVAAAAAAPVPAAT